MSSIYKVEPDIVAELNTLLNNYKSKLGQDLIERKKVYHEILAWRENERIRQKERGFPVPEPILGEKDTSYTWDPWLCMYFKNNIDEDFELSVPSKLNLNY